MAELNLGFENQLWEMADKMRGRMGVKDSEYGNVVLGLIFLKYISDSFEERYNELVDLFSFNMGSKEAKAQDILGRVYEYFLGNFGSSDGEYYTPPTIVKLLVGMIEPYEGRVYDPCCGSGGMFVQSSKFVKEHQGKLDNIHIYGQESMAETWRLCKMNLAIRGIDGNLGDSNADTFGNDKHKMLKADFILGNPPFNIKDWGAPNLQDDVRFKYGMPPNLFYNVTIPVCLWFISKNKENRKDKILFIDARKMETMVTRKHRELSEVRLHDYISTPGRYVGIEEVEDDGVSFDEKMTTLTAELAEMFIKSHELEEKIKSRLGAIGYAI